ncbi:hypothetical protein [Geosporobacter ferrireducens]|uniref:Uncharacterized protein n=1 Tax=Geosporobacter ferrireducens TaxID=1424294 RepID=A0A1D8GCC0_9FIRM|nr:hypothetical protein [Geosporobacter ferrireducens]AOT68559.1 hypothetical protein Gferi_02480 [Geosporobacter ferrireducens]MTI54025.1 hypothetical protein [Geosporobacter ferrireducens]
MNFDRFAASIEEDVLVFALQSNFHEEIERAKNKFYEIIGELDASHEIIVDFNSWLIYDYKDKNKASFIERYHKNTMEKFTEEENNFINQIKYAYLSLYEIRDRTGDQYQLRDIFTKKELQLTAAQLEDLRDGELILSRIVKADEGYWAVGNRSYIPVMFRNSIERNMINRYEEFIKANSYGTWEVFLKTHSLYLYKYVSIIQDVLVHEGENEEDYSVWQSIYLIKDGRNIKQILSEKKQINLDYEENGTLFFRIMTGEGILAEMVIKNNRMELECNSLQDRKEAKKLVESLLEDRITHYKDEKINLDDIL